MSREALNLIQAQRKALMTVMSTQIKHHLECLEALHHSREQMIMLIERDERCYEVNEMRELIINYESTAGLDGLA